MANEDWHIHFSCSYTDYLGMVGSDHCPLVSYLDNKVQRRRGQFRFDKRRIGQDDLLESLERGRGRDSGKFERFRIENYNCRHKIATWRKNNPPYGKIKLVSFKKLWKKYKLKTTELKKTFGTYLGSYKKHTRTKKTFENRRAEICGTHQEILTKHSIMP